MLIQYLFFPVALPALPNTKAACQVLESGSLYSILFPVVRNLPDVNPWRSYVDSGRPRKTHLAGLWSTAVDKRSPHTFATPFLASLRLPALPRPRFGVNGLGMSRATILESGVVIRFEFFELQPFKVDQFFRGFFRYFPMLIKLKYIQK